MLRHWILLWTLILSGPLLAESLDDATKAYDQGEFAKAVSIYEGLINNGARHGSLYYNLGNAYFRKGEKGNAIAAYLAARRLMPRSPDVKANLKFVHEQGADKLSTHMNPTVFRALAFWVDYLSPKEPLFISAVLGCVGLLLLFLTLVVPRMVFLRPWSLMVSLLAFLGFGVFTTSLYFEETWGAVSSTIAAVRSGPGEGNTVVFQLHEGAPFLVEDLAGDWYRIQLSDGKLGWLPAKDAKVFLF